MKQLQNLDGIMESIPDSNLELETRIIKLENAYEDIKAKLNEIIENVNKLCKKLI